MNVSLLLYSMYRICPFVVIQNNKSVVNEFITIQTQILSDELVGKTVGDRVGVSPIVTIEPRRRKFHRPITVTIPLPVALHGKQPGDRLPTLRLLCSITGIA